MNERTRQPEAALDRDALRARLGGNGKLIREMARVFQKEGPELLEVLGEALGRGDAHAAERAAHSLKGTVGCLAGPEAAAAATAVEQLARAGDLQGAAAALPELRQQVEYLRTALARLAEEGTDEGADRG
jgi:HPt (histidine-containing phosphotransfer) domain-containing protein